VLKKKPRAIPRHTTAVVQVPPLPPREADRPTHLLRSVATGSRPARASTRCCPGPQATRPSGATSYRPRGRNGKGGRGGGGMPPATLRWPCRRAGERLGPTPLLPHAPAAPRPCCPTPLRVSMPRNAHGSQQGGRPRRARQAVRVTAGSGRLAHETGRVLSSRAGRGHPDGPGRAWWTLSGHAISGGPGGESHRDGPRWLAARQPAMVGCKPGLASWQQARSCSEAASQARPVAVRLAVLGRLAAAERAGGVEGPWCHVQHGAPNHGHAVHHGVTRGVASGGDTAPLLVQPRGHDRHVPWCHVPWYHVSPVPWCHQGGLPAGRGALLANHTMARPKSALGPGLRSGAWCLTQGPRGVRGASKSGRAVKMSSGRADERSSVAAPIDDVGVP
jgi:hypothetical protein